MATALLRRRCISVIAVAGTLLLMLASCAGIRSTLHAREGESSEILYANGFPLALLRKDTDAKPNGAESATIVFIEGDGLPWATRNIPSLDPTPRRPVALELFRATDGAVIYLGRPCYWFGIAESPCRPHYWTNGRFSPEVVESMVVAFQDMRQRVNARKFILVGYSGGGVLAVLLSHRLRDIVGVIALAAPLAHHLWTERLELEPLSDSLNPEKEDVTIQAGRPEVLVYGTRDRTVQASDAGTYSTRSSVQTITLGEADHICCWLDWWRSDGLAFARLWAEGSRRPQSTSEREMQLPSR